MSITKRILFGLTVFILLIGLSNLIFIINLRTLKEATRELKEEWGELDKLEVLHKQVILCQEELQQIQKKNDASLPQRINIKKFISEVSYYRKQFIQKSIKLHPIPHETKEKRMIQMIFRLAQEIVPAFSDITEGEKLSELEFSNINSKLQKLNIYFFHLSQEDQKVVRDSMKEVDETREEIFKASVSFGFIFIILGAGYGFFFYWRLMSPIRKIRNSIREVTSQNFTNYIYHPSKDELGEIARDFNQMISKLNDAWSDMENKIQKRTEIILQGEKLAGMGEMAGRMAHELNTPLATISGCAEGILKRGRDQEEKNKESLKMIRDESFRCRKIAQNFLGMTRMTSETHRPIPFDKLVSETIDMMKYLPHYECVEIKKDLHPFHIVGQADSLRQCVINLLKNAMESSLKIHKKGKITVILKQKNKEAWLQIKDDGDGFDPDKKEQLFEKFYTTKDSGQGTGLGLAIVRQIAEEHHGRVVLESEGQGKGCVATLCIPLKKISGEIKT